jgi:hypothetical protein
MVVCLRRRVGGIVLYLVACLLVLGLLARFGAMVRLPDDTSSPGPAQGGIGVATHELLGRPDPTDFLVDYASARALITGRDAYDISERLFSQIGIDWPVSTANPHPPTFLTFVLPLAFVRYGHALQAWAFFMIIAMAGTIRLLGARWRLSVPAALGLALTMPGAYGITNPVPLIGLGVAMAYRWRDRPFLAGMGIALAAAPKLSGLILVVPFLVTRRWRAVGWAGAGCAVLAGVPVILQPGIWGRYLTAGTYAIAANEARSDNASLIRLGQNWAIPGIAALITLGALAVLLAFVSKDAYWPTVWLIVASLPVAWLYSLLTFLPIVAYLVVQKRRTAAVPLLTIATALMLASPPLGRWPVVVFPLVVVLVYGALLASRSGQAEFALPFLHGNRAPSQTPSFSLEPTSASP